MKTIYEGELKRMGVKKIPEDIVAQARLFAKLNSTKANKPAAETGNGKTLYKDRGLQVRTWGNKGEGY